MARTSADTGPQRYKSASRKLFTSRSRRSWRTPARKYPKKTPAEKKAIREKNHARRTEYAAALAAAQAVVRAEAQLLRDKFGAHSLQWYMEAILQQPRITKGTRKVNRWNAFLQSEVKRINSGKCFI